MIFFLMMSAGALYYVQARQIAPKTEQTSTVLSASTAQATLEQDVVRNEVTTDDLQGKLVTTNTKPEANHEVTFSLEEFTNHPEASYYLKLGDKRLNFQNGKVKYRFPTEGDVAAELRCAFRGKDVVLDREVYEVTNRMQRTTIASKLED